MLFYESRIAMEQQSPHPPSFTETLVYVIRFAPTRDKQRYWIPLLARSTLFLLSAPEKQQWRTNDPVRTHKLIPKQGEKRRRKRDGRKGDRANSNPGKENTYRTRTIRKLSPNTGNGPTSIQR